MKRTIRLTESDLRKVIKESVSKILNETVSPDDYSALKQLLAKSFGNLNDNEKQYLYDLLNNETWETVYAAMDVLKPYNPNNKVND